MNINKRINYYDYYSNNLFSYIFYLIGISIRLGIK